MNSENQSLDLLRTLILKSQSEPLSESEIAQLNDLIQSAGGAEEAAALIDQLCAFADSTLMDSMPSTKATAKTDVIQDGIESACISSAGNSSEGTASAGNMAASTGSASTGSASTGSTPPILAIGPSDRGRPNLANGMLSAGHDATDANPPSVAWGYWLLALVASNLIVASLAYSLAKPLPGQQPTAAFTPESNSPELVSPQLVSMTACVWRSGESDPEVGKRIQTGEVLDLLEGIAELKIGDGTPREALVRIEGPASVFIRDDGQLGVLRGSLTLKSLGTGSENVVVDTPIGEVFVDGQSFIGLVSNTAVNEVHLFSGRVVVSHAHGAAGLTQTRLEEGEAVRFTSTPEDDLGFVIFDASLSSFVSARSSGFDPLNVGDRYERAVMESRPNIYWRFESVSPDRPHVVENQGSEANMNAAIIGESGWRRYGDNRVAELGKAGTHTGFRSTGLWPMKPLKEYTIEMWVKPELYHNGTTFCMHESRQKEDGRYSHSIILETSSRHWHSVLENLQPNRFRFLHRTPASGAVTEGSNLMGAKPYQVRTWHHLAARKENDRLSLWVDGRMSAERTDTSLLNENMQIVIGQLYVTRNERRYIGQVDEVAIYDRCLSPQEVRRHIKAAGRSVANENFDPSVTP